MLPIGNRLFAGARICRRHSSALLSRFCTQATSDSSASTDHTGAGSTSGSDDFHSQGHDDAYDIIISGGGMVGAAMAAALGKKQIDKLPMLTL